MKAQKIIGKKIGLFDVCQHYIYEKETACPALKKICYLFLWAAYPCDIEAQLLIRGQAYWIISALAQVVTRSAGGPSCPDPATILKEASASCRQRRMKSWKRGRAAVNLFGLPV